MTSNNLQHLMSQLANPTSNPLVLFLGAGVNANLIPGWDRLLELLVCRAVMRRLGNESRNVSQMAKWLSTTNAFSAYQKASLIKRLLGKQYHYVLRSILYDEIPEDALSTPNASLLLAIADLCQSPRVHAVVTYNYDDLLEEMMKRRPRKAQPVCGRHQFPLASGYLPICHVHGYLPHRGRLVAARTLPLVLCQEEYHQSTLEPYSWQITTQLHFLRNYVCLFLGTSLRDMNLLRLLSHAQSYAPASHTYALMAKEGFVKEGLLDDNYKQDELADEKVRVFASLLDDVNIRLVLAGDKYSEVEECVRNIYSACPTHNRGD